MAEPMSLFARLQARRAAVTAGDPTAGESMGTRGPNQAPVQDEVAANLTPEQRRARAKALAAAKAKQKK